MLKIESDIFCKLPIIDLIRFCSDFFDPNSSDRFYTNSEIINSIVNMLSLLGLTIQLGFDFQPYKSSVVPKIHMRKELYSNKKYKIFVYLKIDIKEAQIYTYKREDKNMGEQSELEFDSSFAYTDFKNETLSMRIHNIEKDIHFYLE